MIRFIICYLGFILNCEATLHPCPEPAIAPKSMNSHGPNLGKAQSAESVDDPGQNFPPYEGVGLSQVLDLEF